MGRHRKPQKRIFSDEGWLYYCSMCNGYKPEYEFHNDKNRPFGKYYICKEHRLEKYQSENEPMGDMSYLKLVYVSKYDIREKNILLTKLGYDIDENVYEQFLNRIELRYGKKLE